MELGGGDVHRVGSTQGACGRSVDRRGGGRFPTGRDSEPWQCQRLPRHGERVGWILAAASDGADNFHHEQFRLDKVRSPAQQGLQERPTGLVVRFPG